MVYALEHVRALGRLLLAVVAATAVASTANAQSAPAWAQVVANAEKEGTVVFYTSLIPSAIEDLNQAFKKAYPKIQLQANRNVDSNVALRVRQEQAAKSAGADLFAITTYDAFDEQIEAGLLVMPSGPNFAQYAKATYRRFAPVISAAPVGLAYNTDLVRTAPRSYMDLMRPEMKGAIGTMTTDAGATPTVWYDYLRRRFPGFWEQLQKQEPKLYGSAVPLAQAVASGEVMIGAFGLPATVNPLIAKGAAVKFVIPDASEAFGLEWLAAIVKNAQHPNAAQVFLNFVLSPEGQAVLNANGAGISALPGIPGALPQMKIITIDPKTYPAERIRAISDEWKSLFNKR